MEKYATRLPMIGWRSLLAGLGWWIISENQIPLFPAGLLAVIVAVALSLWLAPAAGNRIRPGGLLVFLGYFLGRSLVAGFDVAWRILHPRVLVEPAIERVPLSFAPGPPRWLLANTLSLLPGTLSVAFEGDVLVLHCLSRSPDRQADVRAVERQVARVFTGVNTLAEGPGL